MSTPTQSRVLPGVPSGGEFSATAHSDNVPDLRRPVIEEMPFSHNDVWFDLERDGDGMYTIYSADDEGAGIASFTYFGDPGDRDAIEASAAEALASQHERLAPVSSRGARVLWTDPDGGEIHPGKVVAAKGEIITVALTSGGEAEVFGNELTVDEAATKIHHDAISANDAPVVWTDPATGEKVHGRSLGPVGGDNFAFQVPSEGGFSVAKAHELEMAPAAPPAPPVKFTETLRKIRGHNFYAPKAVMKKVPALGATEDVPFEDKQFHLHYFTGGASNWFIAEVDQSTGRAFGLMDPSGRGDGSWGYVSLPELEAFNPGGYRVIERDCYFSQGNLEHVMKGR